MNEYVYLTTVVILGKLGTHLQQNLLSTDFECMCVILRNDQTAN